MSPFTKGSIKRKLTLMVMVITVSSLILAGSIFISVDMSAAEDSMSSRINTLTRVISDRITASIIFDDPTVAEQMLSALEQDQSILLACVYVEQDSLFALYSRDNKKACPKTPRDIYLSQNKNQLEFSQAITINEKNIGSLYVIASAKELNERLLWFALIAIVVTLLASIIAFFAVITMQKYITDPLIKLKDITDEISKNGNYNQVLPTVGDDEIASLCRSFGLMMDQIHHREAERQRAEDTLKQSENRFRALIENAPISIHEIDLNGCISSMNASGLKMINVNDESAICGLNYLDNVCEKDRPNVRNLLNKAFLGKASFFEFGGTSEHLPQYFSSSFVPIKDEKGVVQRLMGITVDLSEVKANENALRRSQKMDAIGQLTGGIAHDFNNILGIIMGNLELLKIKLSGDEPTLERIEKALKGTQRGADITHKLLRFSRDKAQGDQLICANDIISNIDDLVAKSLTVTIEVQTHLSEDLWPIRVDPGDLEDAILNLSLNAKDAMPEGGTLIIETTNKVLNESYVKSNPESSLGEFIMISVSDTGTGMPEDVKERVLEPFFTTKEQGKGTGLGLSMVYGFIQRSGGHIKIYSELEEGTIFHLFLPRERNNEDNKANEERPPVNLARGTETILIVDDEDALLDIASEYLSPLGYTLLTANNTKQALATIKENKAINLVFSDVIMPGDMDGYHLAEASIKASPKLKVLLASGFTKKRESEMKNENAFLLNLAKKRLHKPYNQQELSEAIRHTLDED